MLDIGYALRRLWGTHLARVLVAFKVAGTQVPWQYYALCLGHIGAHVVEAVTGM